MVASEEAVKEHNLTPLARCPGMTYHMNIVPCLFGVFASWAGQLYYLTPSFFFRIVGYGVAGCEPTIMGIGPVPSIQVESQFSFSGKFNFFFPQAMLEKTGVSMGEVDQVGLDQ